MAEAVLDRVVADIADRAPIDWSALEREAGSQEEREWLACLKVIGNIADLHASDEVETAHVALQPTTSVSQGDEKESQKWGKYELVEKVGEGGFGSVYRAWDPDLQLEVAIKILHNRVSDDRLKQNLLLEGRALAQLRHDNVVRVLSVESCGDQIALRMEFVRGQTLEDLVQHHGTFNAREAALIGEDVCRALAAVHLKNLVHRDVKARNVMREKAGRIVLMDFGAGRHAEDLKVAGRVRAVGTPLYMAPEVLAAQPASVSSDVYAVGVLLYYLVTGEYPVEGRSVDEIKLSHMQGRRRPLDQRRADLPAVFIRVVESALEPDPARRCPTAAQLLKSLAEVTEVHVRPTPWERLKAVLLWTCTAGLVAIGLGFVTSLEFNLTLGRADFVNETVWDWGVWGLRSSLGAAFTVLLVVFALSLALVARRLLSAASNAVRGLDARMTGGVMRLGRSLRLDDASVRASAALLASAAVLMIAWFVFSPLLADVLLNGELTTATLARLETLAPSNRPYHELYRKVFTGVLIFSGVMWFVVWRFAPRPRDLFHHGIWGGAAAVFMLSLLSLILPYRVFYQNKFDVVTWAGAQCYVLGERDDDLLLFCPALAPSRNRTIKKAGAAVEYIGRKENIFTAFQGAAGPPAGVGR